MNVIFHGAEEISQAITAKKEHPSFLSPVELNNGVMETLDNCENLSF